MIKVTPLPNSGGRKIIYTDETTFPTGKVSGQNLVVGDILTYIGTPAQQLFWTGTKWATNLVSTIYGTATTAEVNVGKAIVPAKTGMTIKIVNITLQAIGGAAATAVSVDIADSDGTVFAVCPIAALTQDTVAPMSAMTIANINAALVANKGIKIQRDGGANALATCTHVNYVIEYACA